MIFSCATENVYDPILLAGTWKQYSKKAIPQLIIITFQSGESLNFKWPYQAKVINVFEMIRRNMVLNIRIKTQ